MVIDCRKTNDVNEIEDRNTVCHVCAAAAMLLCALCTMQPHGDTLNHDSEQT